MRLHDVFTGKKDVRKWTVLAYATVLPALGYWLFYRPMKWLVTSYWSRKNTNTKAAISTSRHNPARHNMPQQLSAATTKQITLPTMNTPPTQFVTKNPLPVAAPIKENPHIPQQPHTVSSQPATIAALVETKTQLPMANNFHGKKKENNRFVVTAALPEQLTPEAKAALPAPAYLLVKEGKGKPWQMFFITIGGGGQGGTTEGSKKHFEPKSLAEIAELKALLLDTVDELTTEISAKLNQILENQTRESELSKIFNEFINTEESFRDHMKSFIEIADADPSQKLLAIKFFLKPYRQLGDNPFPSSDVFCKQIQEQKTLPAQITYFTSTLTACIASSSFQKSMAAMQTAITQYEKCLQWFTAHFADKQKTLIDGYLIEPVQRPMRYGLLLKNTVDIIEKLFPQQDFATDLITLHKKITEQTQQIQPNEQKTQRALIHYLFQEVQKVIETGTPSPGNQNIILNAIETIVTLATRDQEGILVADQGALKCWNDLCSLHSLELNISPLAEERALLIKSCENAIRNPTLEKIIHNRFKNLEDTYLKNDDPVLTDYLRSFQAAFVKHLSTPAAQSNQNLKYRYQVIIYQMYLDAYVRDALAQLKKTSADITDSSSFLMWMEEYIIRGLDKDLVKRRGQKGLIIEHKSELSDFKQHKEEFIFKSLRENGKKHPDLLTFLASRLDRQIKTFQQNAKAKIATLTVQTKTLQTEVDRLQKEYLAESHSYFQQTCNFVCRMVNSETLESRLTHAKQKLAKAGKAIEKTKEKSNLFTKAAYQCLEKIGVSQNMQLMRSWYRKPQETSTLTKPLEKKPLSAMHQTVLSQLESEKSKPPKNTDTLGSFGVFTATEPPPLLSQWKKREEATLLNVTVHGINPYRG